MSINDGASIGLFFEVTPHLGHSKHYFSHVEKLKPELAKHSGLVWLNRYQTLADDCTLLSYQLWENEKSIENWRNNKMHRLAQVDGINAHFKDYRIRVGQRVFCWVKGETIKLSTWSPADSNSLLLCVQSEAVIPHDSFAKLGSFESAYCGLSALNHFVTLVRPNELFCIKSLESFIKSDLSCKIDLFLISRDYRMGRHDLVSQDTTR